jgi:geranylgeranyl diphosphate synthase type I
VLTHDAIACFESYLEAVVDRLAGDRANHRLIRRHFAFDEPGAKRGKRLRPRILIAAAQAEGAPAESAFAPAAAVELLHNFSLVHDDIEDGDAVRHGRPALWAAHGIPAALSAGDAMCALAHLALLAGTPRPAAEVAAMARCLHRAHHALCRGQSYDIGFETARAVAFGEYLTMIEGKTAALFGASCELGARAAGAAPERARAYGAVGRAYGLAFQVRDDVLGSWGAFEQTGKPAGADVRRRKWSFPVAWAMDGPPSPDRDTIAAAYAAREPLDDARADAVLAALVRLGAQDAADAACAAYISQAKDIAAVHALDRAGELAAIFDATARRTA